MPTFELTDDNGHDFEIDAPDQATAAAAFHRMVSGAAPAPAGLSAGMGMAQGSPDETAPPPPDTSPMGWTQQIMSGVNEGLAAGLGAPVDLATDALNLGSMGSNALFHTSLPQITNPMGGSGTFRSLLSPTIKPESADQGQQAVRRVADQVGAMLIPGGGTVAKAEKPFSTAVKEIAAALAGGGTAAVADQIIPNNQLVDMAAALAGGGLAASPESVFRGRPQAAVSVADMRAAKSAAYDAASQQGAVYNPQAYDKMLQGLTQEVSSPKEAISPTRHANAYSFIQDMMGERGTPKTLTQLDQIRQNARRDLVTPAYGSQAGAADAHFGGLIIDHIDNMIDKATPADMAAGSSADAAAAITNARMLNTRYRKVELLQNAVDKAKLMASASGSGGNVNNAIRQQFRQILTNPKKVASFTSDETEAMRKIVSGGPLDDLMRLLGKAAPGNNGLIGVLEVMGSIAHPATIGLPLAGMVAKGFADNATMRRAANLQDMVASGGTAPVAHPLLSDGQKRVLAALTYGTDALNGGPSGPVYGGVR